MTTCNDIIRLAMGQLRQLRSTARRLLRRTLQRMRAGGSARVHRTREDVVAKVALEHYDVALASEWSSEAPTKPDSGTIRAAKGPGSDRT